MKKLMFAAAALAAGVALADVSSANIVGYHSKEMTPARYNMLAVPFGGIGMNGNWNPNKDVTYTDVYGDTSESVTACDNMLLWDATSGSGGGYVTMYYYYDSGDDTYNGWWTTGKVGVHFVGDDIYPEGFPAGDGLWYLSRKSDKTPVTTASGEVPSNPTISQKCYFGRYSFLSNPYPVNWKINADQTQWEGSYGDTSESVLACDNILVWDPTSGTGGGYLTCYYYYDSGDKTYNGWWTTGKVGVHFVGEDGIYPNGFPIGEQVWYLSRNKTYVDKDSYFLVTHKNPVK